MSEPLRRWEEVEAYALTLPGTERGTTYRMPTVRIAGNGRGFVWTGHEAETSFAIWAAPGGVEMLIETDPDAFWQSPHYVDSNAVAWQEVTPGARRKELFTRCSSFFRLTG